MRTSRFVIPVILALSVPSLARSTTIQATSSTQYLWYEDLLSNHQDQSDVAEFLRFNVLGLDQAGKIDVHGYGRLVGQLTSDVERRPHLFDDTTGRLYYLFLDYRDALPGHLDLQLGRTYVPAAAVPGVVDGLYLRGRDLGLPGLGATAFGGHRVLFDNKVEVEKAGDLLAGASVYLDAPRHTHLEASYARAWADERFARELASFDLSTTPLSFLNLVGRYQHDLVASRTAELLVDVNVFPLKDLVLRGEYLQNTPSFDRDSFYRFFNVTDYRELGAWAEYRLGDNYRVSARYAAEDFDRSSSANVWGVGLFAHPLQAITVNASYDDRQGFGSRLSGLRLDAAFRFGRALLGAGIDYDDFRNTTARTDTARGYWVRGEFKLNETFGVSARAERVENFSFSRAYQGFVALNVNI